MSSHSLGSTVNSYLPSQRRFWWLPLFLCGRCPSGSPGRCGYSNFKKYADSSYLSFHRLFGGSTCCSVRAALLLARQSAFHCLLCLYTPPLTLLQRCCPLCRELSLHEHLLWMQRGSAVLTHPHLASACLESFPSPQRSMGDAVWCSPLACHLQARGRCRPSYGTIGRLDPTIHMGHANVPLSSGRSAANNV